VTIDVADNAAALQYEVTVDGEPAGLIRYTRDGNTITMVHTEVAPKLEGQGVGSELVKRALDDVRAKGERVRPVCPFVAAYIDEHPEYADLIDE
jgi:predicted GNAT family acetyltransferase